MAKKNKREIKPAPVVTGYDERPEKRSRDGYGFENKTEAPDGISGSWG